MKKVYIKPECGFHILWGKNLLDGQSYDHADSRKQRDATEATQID